MDFASSGNFPQDNHTSTAARGQLFALQRKFECSDGSLMSTQGLGRMLSIDGPKDDLSIFRACHKVLSRRRKHHHMDRQGMRRLFKSHLCSASIRPALIRSFENILELALLLLLNLSLYHARICVGERILEKVHVTQPHTHSAVRGYCNHFFSVGRKCAGQNGTVVPLKNGFLLVLLQHLLKIPHHNFTFVTNGNKLLLVS
mmetsp:Transcript_35440/g.57204  ORF Transcript_35440/g.57204 Transcript_35440/m.57204 type:complete len:201 (+) Transcript_35440:784-1386(+)